VSDLNDVESRFTRLEKSGATGVSIDLMHRADQQMIDVYRGAAEAAAKHHLMVEFQNAPTQDGIERTWPNVVSREDAPLRRLRLP
jgi:alpha-glucosidase